MLRSLRKAAEDRGHSSWARGPDNAGSYNSRPLETGFFCDGGDYDGYYGRFFLNWYSQIVVDHGDRVLSLAKLTFGGTRIAAKVCYMRDAIFFWVFKFEDFFQLHSFLFFYYYFQAAFKAKHLHLHYIY